MFSKAGRMVFNEDLIPPNPFLNIQDRLCNIDSKPQIQIFAGTLK